MIERRWWIAALAGVVLVVCAPGAQAQAVQLGVGPSVGIGDDKGTGFHVGAGVGLATPALPVGLRLEGMYQRIPEGGDDHEYVGGLLSAELGLPFAPINPYLVGGAGLYWHREHHGDHTHDAHTDIGLNIGVGTRFGLAGLNAFVEARLHNLFGGDDDHGHGHGHSGNTFIPVTFGIRF